MSISRLAKLPNESTLNDQITLSIHAADDNVQQHTTPAAAVRCVVEWGGV